MSEQPPEPQEPDTRESDQPRGEPDPDQPEPLQVSEPIYDTVEKGRKHEHETRESEMETKEAASDE